MKKKRYEATEIEKNDVILQKRQLTLNVFC